MAGRVRAGTAYIDVRLGSFQQFKSAALAQAQQVGNQMAKNIGATVAKSPAVKNAGTQVGRTIGTSAAAAVPRQFGRVGTQIARVIGPQGVVAAKDFVKQFGAGVGSLFSSSSQKFAFSSSAFRAAGSNAATVFSSAFNTIGAKIGPALKSAAVSAGNFAVRLGSGIGSALSSLRANVGRAGEAMRNFSQQLGLTSFMAQSLGYRLTFLATGPVLAIAAGLGAIGISSALNLEQATAGIAAFVGGMKNAQKEVQILAKIAQNSPAFDTTQIIAYAKSILSTGLSVQKTNALFQASSNIFTTLGLSVDEANGAFTAITQVMQKGKVQSEELSQQLAERGVPIWKILADAMGVTQAQLVQLVSAGKVTSQQFVDAMIKAGNSKTYLEGAGLGADTLKSKLANLKEQVQFQLAQAFQQKLFPVLKQFIDKYGPEIVQLLTTLAVAVIPPIVSGVQKLADMIQSAVDYFRQLSPEAKGAAKTLLGVLVAAGPVILAISALASSVSAVVGAIGFLAANPEIALLVGALALIGGAAISARDKIVEFFTINQRGQKILEGFKSLVDKIKGLFEGLKPAIDGVLKFLGDAFDGFFGTFNTDRKKLSASKGNAGRDKDLLPQPPNGTVKAFAELRGYLGDIAKILRDDIKPAIDKVKDAFNSWMQDPKRVLFLKAVLYTIVVVLGIIITTVVLVVDVFANVFATIVDVVNEVFGGIVDVVGGFFQVISGIFTGNWTAIKDGVMSILLGLAHLIYGTLGAMIKGIIGIVGAIVGPFIAPFKKAYDILVGHSIIPELVTAILAWIGRLPSGIVGKIAAIPGAVAGVFRSMASAAVSTVSGMVSQVASTAGSIRGRVLSAIGNLGGLLVGAGKSLIQGLINGMRSMLSEVSKIAAQIAGKADEAVAHRLQAHSPSRVGMKRGQQFGQGFWMGMDDTRKSVEKSATKLAEAAIPKSHGYDPANQVGTYGGTQGDTYINVNVPAPVQDPREIADYTVRSLASRLANRTI
jgi:tape measure domain-containing protein